MRDRLRRGACTLILTLGAALAATLGSGQAALPTPTATARLQPSPEMARLFRSFLGDWNVHESFEVSGDRRGSSRDGTATFRESGGFSLVEDYHSAGTAGELHFLALLWWEPGSRVYRVLTCANDDGCAMRGTARWEGVALVNTFEEKGKDRTIVYRDSFVEITPDSFTLVSEGVSGGKTVWRVTTRYTGRRPAR